MVKLYEEWISPEKVFSMEVKNRDITYYERIASEVRMIISHFQLTPSRLEVLDFGMGWGEWCRMAQAYGCSVFGTELSQTRIAYAKTFGIPILGHNEMSERQFDFINTEQVFEHLPNPLATFQYLCNSLKPDGVIKISVPNGWDIKRRLAIMDWTAAKGSKNSLNPVAPLEHINCFTHRAIVKMAEISGYEPVKVRVRLPLNSAVLNFTGREVVRPYLHKLRTLKPGPKKTTYLFFQRRKESGPA